MADDFQTRNCSSSWWSSSRSLFTGSSSPCSTSLGEMSSSFGWSSCQDAASANSGSHNIPIDLHDSQRAQATESVADSNVLIDSELPMSGFGLSSPAMDWNHCLASGRARSNYTRVQEDHLNTSQKLMQEGGATTQSLPSNSYSMSSSSFGYPSPFLQGLFERDSLSTHQSSFENQTAMSYNSSINSSNDQFQQSWPKILPQFLQASPPKQQDSNQLHLSNSASSNFWNTMSIDDKASLYSPPQCSQPQIFTNVFEEKPISCTNLSTVKRNGEEIRDSCSMTTKKATSSEGSFKRPRVETPSPLPTFKVRKEKLGDRITALQQLVSPFGKTDTASVLYEAIEYIKFLHDQVNVLSTPYMKNGAPMQQQQSVEHVVSSKDGDDGAKQGLLRRGLCLVPISSTFSVTIETTADFWTPTFGGTFR